MHQILYSIRKLAKAPLFTGVAVLCVALGIGANTAIFSLINTILLRPLPFYDVNRLILLGDVFQGPGAKGERVSVTQLTFATLRKENRVFSHMGAVMGGDFAITGGHEPEYVQGTYATWDWLTTMGIKPLRGRTFLAEEDLPGQPAAVAVIGYNLWKRRFGDQDAVGRDIILNDRSYKIVGILPAKTQYPYQAELWVPMGLDPADRNQRILGVFGQMKPGVTLEQVRQDLDRLYKGLAKDYPDTNAGWTFEMRVLGTELLQGIQPRLFLLLAAVGFLLLIACANVANMMLARANELRGEIGIRLALGANRGRLVRQLLTESLLIAATGGALGLFLARFSLGLLVVLSPIAAMNAFYQDISIDGRVLLFTVVVSLLVGLLFGLLPALRATRPDLQNTLTQGGQRAGTGVQGRRLLGLLVVVETALAVVLLVGAGLMVDSLRRFQAEDPGFAPEKLLMVRFTLPEARYGTLPRQTAFYDSLLQQVRALPEVKSASLAAGLPLSALDAERILGAGTVEGRPLASPNDFIIFNHRVVSANYLETLGVQVLEGRTLNAQDGPGSVPVAVVSKETARLFWPGQSALGKRLKRGMPDSTRPWMTVVGVVSDVSDYGLGVTPADAGPTWYLPVTQQSAPGLTLNLVLRTRVEPLTAVQAVKRVTARLDPTLPLYKIGTMEDRLADSYRAKQFVALLLTLLGALGLTLAAMGIYGIMSYAVSQQKRDIGIRMALGASHRDVVGLIVRHGMTLAGIGLAIGLFVAVALSRLIVSVFPNVNPAHVSTYVLMSVSLLAVALLACYLPARRSTRIDPLMMLREG
jgi:putative ABC transport system permease protein